MIIYQWNSQFLKHAVDFETGPYYNPMNQLIYIILRGIVRMAVQSTPTNGKAVASLVLGIVSIVLGWIFWIDLVGIAAGIIGLVLGISAKKEAAPSGMATAGIVLSIVGIAIGGIIFLSCMACARACVYLPWYTWGSLR